MTEFLFFDYLIVLVFAASVSFVGSLAGFGGGVFVVPLLVIGFHVPIEVAIGVTAMSLVPSSFITSAGHLRRHALDLRLLRLLAPPLVVGAPLGASLTTNIDPRPLQFIFGIFLAAISIQFLRKKSKMPSQESKPLNQPYLIATLSFLSGAFAGLLGIGGGLFMTPLLVSLMKLPVRSATALAIATILFTSLSSGVSHWYLGHFDQNLFISVALGFSAGALTAQRLGFKLQDHRLISLIGWSFLASALVLLVNLT